MKTDTGTLSRGPIDSARSDFLKRLLARLHLDLPLLFLLLLLCGVGLLILFSASEQNQALINRQLLRLGLAFLAMLVIAQIPPHYLRLVTPWLFVASLGMLLAVLIIGDIGKGAQRWLNLGLFRFQPSELTKLALPMIVAWYLADKPLPLDAKRIIFSVLLIVVPVLMIAKQPDLGTSILVLSSGVMVLFLAGLSWRYIIAGGVLAAATAPVVWYFMHNYQRQRVLTFLNPESDPLGAGYHIIQSKIAIGSGGVYGKGWLNGTQSHLEFLPERSTDFIFAVLGEELGLVGCVGLLVLYLLIIMRGLYIATQGQDTFSRLLAGGLMLTFFVYLFINTGMVIGLLPVVGLPLPLISYGGTSMVTIMAGFGILMSIHTHRKLLAR
ncbi:MAG: rod shape-determining protein RodA [Proteobacteria bacterium]|nr:MAG: rod shape-determining protein RodA [Pseudomonadota bacterium]QKK11339.1 MAG: rod shape-determining protein RodA [Pseudomonadota bacterium]